MWLVENNGKTKTHLTWKGKGSKKVDFKEAGGQALRISWLKVMKPPISIPQYFFKARDNNEITNNQAKVP